METGLAILLMSLGVIAAIAFVVAGVILLRERRSNRLRGWLMILVGIITIINVYLSSSFSVHKNRTSGQGTVERQADESTNP